MHFSDEAHIWVKAGDGGNGSASFRREKFIAKGGPDGGNGGDGGSIIFEGDENMNTLVNFNSKKHYKAQKGEMGHGQNRYGRHGEDMILKVPCGTLVFDEDTGEKIADITEHHQQVIVAKGGLGGKGNANFATSVRQAPDFAELGEPGEEKNLRMELKLIADIAIIGYPSVGKSTLISRISNAKPKIADYPFTTLVPNLGVVKVDDTDFVVADIPGLIEGAHEGKGLGDEFLKHIERTQFLVHLVDITHDDLKTEYDKINNELKLFSKDLAKKPQLLVFNKVDASIPELNEEVQKTFKAKKPLFISSVTGEGLDPFLYRLKEEVIKLRKKTPAKPKVEKKVWRPHLETGDTKSFTIEKVENGFRIHGKRIEQLSVMTNMQKRGAIIRMHDILKKIGAYRQLAREGANEEDKIFIGPNQFDYVNLD